MAWLFLNEKMTNLDIGGLIIATLGVYIATRR
jgi:drug/metabolite transporter (DMT)-like permease